MRKLLTEYIRFLIEAKKWWMIPLVVITFLVIVLFWVAESSAILPYIYALF